MVRLPSGERQLILRSGRTWGNTTPQRIHDDLAAYQLDPETSLQDIVDTYRQVAASTTPDPRLSADLPADIDHRVGIHIRLGDKLVDFENDFDMSLPTWEAIQQDTHAHVEQCIAAGEPLFVCSDDLEYRDNLVQEIAAKGGDVVVANPSSEHKHLTGYEATVDFFALSRCKRVVQMTKYSTFSMAAALVGKKPLVNFYRDTTGVGHRLDAWRSVFAECAGANQQP